MYRRIYALIFGLSLALPVYSWAAISVGNTTSSAGSGTTAIPAGTVTSGGDLLIGSCTGPSGNIAPAGWTNLDFTNVNSPNMGTAYWVPTNTTAVQFANLGGATYCTITDYHGVSATPIDAHSIGSGSSVTPSAPSLANTAVSGEWEYVSYAHCGTFTGPAGETNRGLNATCSSQWGYWSGDSNASLGGAGTSVPAVNGSLGASSGWDAASITFEPASVTPSGQTGWVTVP